MDDSSELLVHSNSSHATDEFHRDTGDRDAVSAAAQDSDVIAPELQPTVTQAPGTPIRDALRDVRDEAWDTWDPRRVVLGCAALIMKGLHPRRSHEDIRRLFVDRATWLSGDSDTVRLGIANDAFAAAIRRQLAARADLLASAEDERLAQVAAVKRQAAILESDIDETAKVLEVYQGTMSPSQSQESVAAAYTARVARLRDDIEQLNTERQPHPLESDSFILGAALCAAHDAVAAHQVRREAESSARNLGTRVLDRVINWSR